MVRKLFKHECIAYGRVMLPIYAILAAFAIVGRIIQIFEVDTIAYNILNGSVIAGFVIGCVFVLGFGTIFGVIRFYRNLFTGEGYLSFTLPVTPTQHLLVKSCTAVMFQLITLVVILLSCSIYTAGDVATELGKAFAYLYNQVFGELGIHLPVVLAEIFLLTIATAFAEYASYYLCIAIGQLANKNRVLAAIGVYVGFTIAGQTLGTILTVLLTVLETNIPVDAIFTWIEQHPYLFIHGAFGVMLLLSAGAAWLYLGITRFIIRRKLNLE